MVTRAEIPFAGRAAAAYGGIDIAVSLGWLSGVEERTRCAIRHGNLSIGGWTANGDAAGGLG